MRRSLLPTARSVPPLLLAGGMTAAFVASAATDVPPIAGPTDGPATCGALMRGAFVESAPRDRFEFAHDSPAGWTVTGLALDLAGSAGRLVFDTEEGGEGVEVFQPFRAEEGAVQPGDVSTPADGDARLSLAFGADGFPAGETFVFSIDVDDRLPASELGQIRVSGGEIEGGRLSVDFVHGGGVTETLVGYFGADARVELIGTPCPG